MEKITKETCLSCGACCVSLHDQNAFCDVMTADEKRLGKRFVRLHVLHSHPIDRLAAAIDGRSSEVPHGAIKTEWREQKAGPFKGVEACACIALKGSLFHKVRCSVYDKRPQTCRVAVKPGDRSCRQIREMFHQAENRV